MFEKLKQAWKRDRLAVLGVGSAVVAFLLWAIPAQNRNGGSNIIDEQAWAFSDARLEAVAAFLALSFILLLLRRR
jgi:hypothetical protein